MNTKQLHTLLGSLSGHLVVDTPHQKKEIGRLNTLLAGALIPADLQELKGSRFSYEAADLFAPESIPTERLNALQAVAEKIAAEATPPKYRVYLREVPVRSSQLQASMPSWAAGAAVDQTIGPFSNLDGRLFWFDFFKIEELAALYIQGRPDPAILFKTGSALTSVDTKAKTVAALLKSYKLPAGSIWINSELLATNAPGGYYTGLTIKGGTVTLSAPPQLIGGKLTLAANTVVTVKLQLQQPAVTDADPSSPYGADARAAKVSLPKQLLFHFSGQGAVIDDIPRAQWTVYGHKASFRWDNNQPAVYDGLLHRVLIPLSCSTPTFATVDNQSPFFTVQGEAPVIQGAWALPAASIDVSNPTPAAGIGALLIKCQSGLTGTWSGLQGGEYSLNQPYVMAEPGRISLTDLTAGLAFCRQTFELWLDEQNPHGADIQVHYPQPTPFFFNTLASGSEILLLQGNAKVDIDRPVTAAGDALDIRSKNSWVLLAATKTLKLIYLFDDNILFDAIDFTQQPPALPRPIALALTNALFKVTPVNGCLLFGRLDDNFLKVTQGFLFLTFGMYAYLPTLPDPYAANLGSLRFQFRATGDPALAGTVVGGQSVLMWLVCRVLWQPAAPPNDSVEVSFHFAPLQNQFQLFQSAGASSASTANAAAPDGNAAAGFAMMSTKLDTLPDYGSIWDGQTGRLQQDMFALLDVSTNADLLGVSFGIFGDKRLAMVTTHVAAPAAGASFPLQVQGLDVVSAGSNVRAFTVPQISWEPVFNLTPKKIQGDPTFGFNYYPDDGGPARVINNSDQQVALAPIPLTNFLVSTFDADDKFSALALFTLPFGLKALALLQKQYTYQGNQRRGNALLFNAKAFPDDLAGARQLEIDGGEALVEGESDMFMGSTIQLNNVLEMDGTAQGSSTLGASVTKIFNNEFLLDPLDLIRQRGVPLTRMDLSGYGASIFSNWLNPKATIAATSQSRFDVFVGRCAHEIIQVKSILYPWAVKVVRTITLFRTASGYAYRYDSGWRAESDGRFDFTYYVNVDDPQNPGKLKPEERQAPYEIHPGVVRGLFNIKNIQETEDIDRFTGQMIVANGEMYVDENGKEQKNTGGDMAFDMELQPVFFDADIDIENPVSGYLTRTIDGQERKLVPSKGILGFVQIAPRGMPLTAAALRDLIVRQLGTIGGPIDCVVDIAASGQQMRLNRFDVSNSFGANGTGLVFAAAGRGSVVLPKDGAWSMVKHLYGTGEVNPVPQNLSVPLIRIGKLIKQAGQLVLDKDPANELLRIADPAELLRTAVDATVNYGFLHSTDTQKALFLTPAFRQQLDRLLSKTPPLFADAFRIVNSKAIFPNIGHADASFGDVISLVSSGAEFAQNAFSDGGKQVMELMQIDNVVANVRTQGYKLLKKIEEFDLPTTEWDLIEIGGAFKIYIEYKADNIQKPQSQGGGTKSMKGSLDFDVDSFNFNPADKWKSLMSNVALVVDLGPIKRLMTVKGNWDAKKGTEAQYRGSDSDPDLPSPQIEFSPQLEPVIEILQILQDLQGENYKEAFQKGLKLAMSNKAGTWEYKFEAAKEIPLVRFPMPEEVYNQPEVPLKLEAGLKLGAYFNAALKVTTDPKQLLPTAGGYLEFYGRLSVMCVSLAAATVYAVGQVNLKIAADTKTGPALALKFGFGAQIVVGLPVVGNVSVLYMVGVEMYVDSVTLNVSAFLLFQGHAELLGGIVGVTITIEAKGTISRSNDRTDLAAQVTFGLDISIFLVIDISFSTSWQEQRQIA